MAQVLTCPNKEVEDIARGRVVSAIEKLPVRHFLITFLDVTEKEEDHMILEIVT